MQRRQFITFIVGAVAAWPLAARGQQRKMPVVGFLNGGSPGGYKVYVTGFLHGPSESGYVEGKNVTVDYQWARGQYDRLQVMAADLVRRKVAVIAANTPAAPVAKAATTEIPIVLLAPAIRSKSALSRALIDPAAMSRASACLGWNWRASVWGFWTNLFLEPRRLLCWSIR